jgi:phosphate transport system substrate-binding protein
MIKMTLKNRSARLALLSACCLVMVFILAGCSSTPSTPGTPASGAAVELTGTITESGSTTVQPLAEKLAAAFTAQNPRVKITIQGGGTGVGIKAASDGTVDIGAASRELTGDDPALVKFSLARDGIAIIVNPANPLNNLTKKQIIDIFSGKITNWSQVGGQNREIHVAAREEGSGTRTAFQDLVMGKDAGGQAVNIVKSAILQSSSGAIVQVVKSDAQAISFDSFGYVTGTVKALSVDGVTATEANAQSGTYPVVRPLYFLTKTQPAGLVKAFLDFCSGSAARNIISGEGYIAIE